MHFKENVCMANYKWKVVFKMNEEYKSDENFENNPEELNNDQTDNNKEVYNNQADSTQEMYNTVNNVQETVNDSVNTQSSGKKKKHKTKACFLLCVFSKLYEAKPHNR